MRVVGTHSTLPLALEEFGDEYRQYKKNTPGFIPRVFLKKIDSPKAHKL
jgi:hypothetical protein